MPKYRVCVSPGHREKVPVEPGEGEITNFSHRGRDSGGGGFVVTEAGQWWWWWWLWEKFALIECSLDTILTFLPAFLPFLCAMRKQN